MASITSSSSSFLEKVAGYKIAGIPAGAVIEGAAVGGVGDAVTGLVQTFAPSVPTFVVKGLLCIGVAKYGKKIIGATGASVGALFLGYDALQSIYDVRGKTNGLMTSVLGKMKGFIPGMRATTSTTSSTGSAF